MVATYNIIIYLYTKLLALAALFNNKAKLLVKGREAQVVKALPKSLWFHFASLGEFEQGRPVLEEVKSKYPDVPVVITFFSPSGYEVRKNTALADAVYYLPQDTFKNARQFIDSINPVMAVFTKYEYWYHYFKQLHSRHIPLYVISGIFRPGQVFFKWYGSLHREMLKMVTWFFVQDIPSKHLLQNLGISNVTISGDTRFDRVWANAQAPKALQHIAEFKNGKKLFVAGSTWPADEALFTQLINQHPGWRFVFAPHEIGDSKIAGLEQTLSGILTVRHSNIEALNEQTRVLIIDNMGMLSALYQYADMVYIGGGFGAGIHNTLEAAAFGVPVIFGPNYQKFKEARDLIEKGAGFSINNQEELLTTVNRLMANEDLSNAAAQIAKHYVDSHIGATNTIMSYIIDKHPLL
ncbi:3-deoxy-D-manno-octulosonic acid transferase [Mucilaginibacter pallidiroseus]|uniref:3-deoxy-D-manno-octulosonic acid transferase n=1 Tax=Mucilaginibacter pallidiroseus TaxID=2599295 RepID=A0A563UFT2_9SPHI|nr:glycosyltransferase N-terminal domain-containing protein [Mucilaginibacter pallidiroseus]TWR30225.1 3-deoxy-D-manno-octulosonic acid transferase [Mucilaginibacter pallidiroseus]